jgi:hypothetical protein
MVPIEARWAFEAAINYWGMVAGLMAGSGIPRPTPETIFQVRLGDRVYRELGKRALKWANELAEKRIRAEERQRR